MMKQNTGKKEYQALLYRTEKYAEQVRVLFANAVNDILSFSSSVPHLEDGEIFSYSDNKKLAKKVSDRLRMLHSTVYAAIKNDITLEWDEANKMCDELAMSALGKEILSDRRFAGWFSRNTDAMEAFIKRTENGLNLSDRVWNTTKQLRSEMELAMTVSIGQGESASSISRRVRQYLNNPDKLFRRIKDEEGNLKLSKAAKAYHPGQGVYRSSAKNAMRLTRSETNIAYRTSDFERWSQMDFVLGIEINLSRSHPEYDICDILAGRYPKDFVFKGWHPQCFCFATPILADIDELDKIEEAMEAGKTYHSPNEVTDMPKNFKEWASENKERIEKAQKRGTLPYFIKDNKKTVERIINPPTALQRAKERHAARTPEQEAAIRKAWNERRATHKYGRSILSYMGGISDVDTSALQNAIKGGDISLILNEARKLKAIGKEILGLAYLDNPMQVARQFSMSEAKIVNDAVQKKLAGWANLPLEKQKSKLSFEIEWVEKNKKYATWEVAQNAYKKQLEKVTDALDWENIGNEFKSISSFKTKSQPYLDLVAKLQDAISGKDKAVAQQTILDIQAKRAQLDKAAAARKKAKFESQFGEDAYSQSRKDAAVWDRHDGSEADAALIDTAGNSWRNATKNEKDFVYEYTSHYCDVNEPLQGRKYFNTQSKDRFIKKVNNITSYIEKNELPVDMWFTRGDDGLSVIKSRIEFAGGTMPSDIQDLVGMVMQESGFMSTGSRKGKGFSNRDVILNIYAPQGTKAAYIEPISAYGNGAGKSWDGIQKFSSFSSEHETLFQRGTQMRITKVYQESGKIYIDCEVVGQEVRDLSYVKDSDIGY